MEKYGLLKIIKTMTTNSEYINEESNASQCARILEHFEKGLTLTSLEALHLFGCFRLASRIHDLRVQGYDIIVERIKTSNGKTVAQYRMG